MAVIASLIVGGESIALCQQPADQTVPLELLEVLTMRPTPDRGRVLPEVLVGRLSDAAARALPLPKGSRIIGSLSYGDFTMSAIAVAGPIAAVRDTLTTRLLAAGWTRPQSPFRGGFEFNMGNTAHFCHGDSASVSFVVVENPRGTYLNATHFTTTENTMCRMRSMPFVPHEPVIPMLAAPAGAQTRGMPSTPGLDDEQSNARVKTALTVPQLLEHYAAQLRSHGWQPLERVGSPAVMSETYRVTDAESVAWHGVLTVSAPSADADRFVVLRVARVKGRF